MELQASGSKLRPYHVLLLSHPCSQEAHLFRSLGCTARGSMSPIPSKTQCTAMRCCTAIAKAFIYIHRYIYIYTCTYIYIIIYISYALYIYINICHQYIAKRLPRDQRRSSIVDLQSSSLYSRMWPQGPKGQSMAKHFMSSLDQRHSQNCNPTIHTLQNYSKLNIINSPLFLAIYCNRLFEFYFISQSSPLATWHGL